MRWIELQTNFLGEVSRFRHVAFGMSGEKFGVHCVGWKLKKSLTTLVNWTSNIEGKFNSYVIFECFPSSHQKIFCFHDLVKLPKQTFGRQRLSLFRQKCCRKRCQVWHYKLQTNNTPITIRRSLHQTVFAFALRSAHLFAFQMQNVGLATMMNDKSIYF